MDADRQHMPAGLRGFMTTWAGHTKRCCRGFPTSCDQSISLFGTSDIGFTLTKNWTSTSLPRAGGIVLETVAAGLRAKRHDANSPAPWRVGYAMPNQPVEEFFTAVKRNGVDADMVATHKASTAPWVGFQTYYPTVDDMTEWFTAHPSVQK